MEQKLSDAEKTKFAPNATALGSSAVESLQSYMERKGIELDELAIELKLNGVDINSLLY